MMRYIGALVYRRDSPTVSTVTSTATVTIPAPPERVLTALADYRQVRPRILTEHYRDYRVVEGGEGAGTVVGWILQATSKRSRNVLATVTVADSTVTETDGNSTMVTAWQVAPAGEGSRVTVTSSWQGASGIGGFFERLFAPRALAAIQRDVLTNLARELSDSGTE